MKKIMVAVIAGAFTLTGCSSFEEGFREGYGSPSSSPSSTASSTSSAPASSFKNPVDSLSTEDQLYLSLQGDPELRDLPPKSEALEFAEITCEGLEDHHFDDVFEASLHAGFSSKTTGALLYWSVSSFCPEHEVEMMEWARNGYY